ncbi:unnamed protein product [Amoebophrya sp. A120]|nr:unnamed protein product [Amoebophrya sp. A120]|eukprot:GSA120T00015117001.1
MPNGRVSAPDLLQFRLQVFHRNAPAGDIEFFVVFDPVDRLNEEAGCVTNCQAHQDRSVQPVPLVVEDKAQPAIEVIAPVKSRLQLYSIPMVILRVFQCCWTQSSEHI